MSVTHGDYKVCEINFGKSQCQFWIQHSRVSGPALGKVTWPGIYHVTDFWSRTWFIVTWLFWGNVTILGEVKIVGRVWFMVTYLSRDRLLVTWSVFIRWLLFDHATNFWPGDCVLITWAIFEYVTGYRSRDRFLSNDWVIVTWQLYGHVTEFWSRGLSFYHVTSFFLMWLIFDHMIFDHVISHEKSYWSRDRFRSRDWFMVTWSVIVTWLL